MAVNLAGLRFLIFVPIALCSFVSVFYTVGKLVVFLSYPVKIPIHQTWIVHLLDDWSKFETVLLPLVTNAIYTVLFILPHSALKSGFARRWSYNLRVAPIKRSIYNLITAVTLLLLINKWERIPALVIWNFDVDSNPVVYWTYYSIHAIAWLLIYGGALCLDFPDLTGVKHVYYDWLGLDDPLGYKHRDLLILYEHVRHPSLVCFSVILWLPNVLSLDRLLLAIIWTTYMYIGWRTDIYDVEYQRQQLERKKTELRQFN